MRARLHKLPRRIAEEGVKTMRTEMLKVLSSDIGADRRMSNVTWQRFALGVDADFSGPPEATMAVLRPDPLRGGGPLYSWLEKGTQGHLVARKRGRGGSRWRVQIGGDWATGPFEVRGMPAKRTWSRGVERGAPKVLKLADKLLGQALDG